MLATLGNPHAALRTFHVAGTNGKGSTCATLDAVLRSRGFRVGRYTSPHLVDFTERIVIDGAAMRRDAVVEWLTTHRAMIDGLGATFFEATTVMAFDVFARSGVDVAVIEVGLGGRLDATNVITPMVAGVTSIGLDHREYLGDTRELIAGEKAGIFKPGVPAVIGERDPAIAAVLRGHAERAGASPIVEARAVFPVTSVRLTPAGTAVSLAGAEYVTPLLGVHQADNLATAITMLRQAGEPWACSVEDEIEGVRKTRLAGRFQRTGHWVFDVAHNAEGVETVVRTLTLSPVRRPLAAVLCVLADKDWRAMLAALLPQVDRVWLTEAPTAPAERRWAVDDAYRAAEALRPGVAVEPVTFDAAMRAASEYAGTVLVTGSFHTVGDALSWLQIDPLVG
jgi:dihydrofolate synthase / folylpolyglutamate synthase